MGMWVYFKISDFRELDALPVRLRRVNSQTVLSLEIVYSGKSTPFNGVKIKCLY